MVMVGDLGFRDDECQELLKLYSREEVIGSGAQGTVYVLRELVSNRTFAGKMFAHKSKSEAEREAQMLRKLSSCPGVVKFERLVREEGGGRCYGTIVMELCGNSLYTERNEYQMPNKVVAEATKTIAQALLDMHRLGVVHRDLKLENVLVKADAYTASDVVLGDLGIATDDVQEMQQYCGTVPYMAPEVSKGSAYTKAVDTWGLGMIAYKLIAGTQSWQSLDALRNQTSPNGVPDDDARDLLQKMLATDPAERIQLEDVLKHPWIVKHCGSDSRTWGCKRAYRRLPPSDNIVVKKCKIC